ncbi:MAG: 3-deoxy-manno-octulosonate cytidylyltransferase [Candidatus Neomarinimicrobiota bacterium]
MKKKPGPRIVGVIPARYHSSRFPGKVLIPVDGLPMVAQVYARAARATVLDTVTVATDSQRVARAMDILGIPLVMTSSNCRTGTDRVAEVARDGEGDIYVNIQGDEPFIEEEIIEQAVQPFLDDSRLKMGTVATTSLNGEQWADVNVVKVRVTEDGFADDFFRSSSGPYPPPNTYKHIGLYVYERKFLLDFSRMKRTSEEKERHLEQMRALDHGIPVKVVITLHDHFSINSPEDLARAREVSGVA